jgi:hypothetical protein
MRPRLAVIMIMIILASGWCPVYAAESSTGDAHIVLACKALARSLGGQSSQEALSNPNRIQRRY